MNESPIMTPEELESLNLYLDSDKEDDEQEAQDFWEIAEANTVLD